MFRTAYRLFRNSLPCIFHGILLLLLVTTSHAQLNIEIRGSNPLIARDPFPIMVLPFQHEHLLTENLSAIVRSDLALTGQFQLLDASTQAEIFPENSPVQAFSALKLQGVDVVVAAYVTPMADGRFEIRTHILDLTQNKNLSGFALNFQRGHEKNIAHKIADEIYKVLQGESSFFMTRLAYVTSAKGKHHLWVSSINPDHAQNILTSSEPIMSPAWSPDGKKLAYVSFETQKPVVYVHNLADGQRIVASSSKGSNSAPTWSPDGNHLALALSRDGHTQIYKITREGKQMQRLSTSQYIDTEPQFSSDGKSIYFTSNRGGSAQIYRMSAQTGEHETPAVRITFQRGQNTSPRISPDGKTLVFISQLQGEQRIYMQNLSRDFEPDLISIKSCNESPSFSADGQYLLYISCENNLNQLAIINLKQKSHAILGPARLNPRESVWGPAP